MIGDVTEKELQDCVDELEASLETQLERVAALEAERDEYLGDLKRIAAEFDNFRKRATRERDAIVERANARLIGECLEILDDLERALAAGQDSALEAGGVGAENGTLMEGVALVEKRLRILLEKEGVTEICTDGVFDPHVHEALLTQPSEEATGTIVDVMQKGYTIGDVVLRPARVAVAGASVDVSSANSEDAEIETDGSGAKA